MGEMGAVGEINTGEHDDLAARAEAVHLDEKLWKKAGGERSGEIGRPGEIGRSGGVSGEIGRSRKIGRSGEIEKIEGDCHLGETARQLGGVKLGGVKLGVCVAYGEEWV